MEKSNENERANEDKILLQPFHYITQIPGKLIRAKLAQAFNMWLNIDEKHLTIISEALQILHNASLLIDDIEDNSNMRRGVPGSKFYSDSNSAYQLFYSNLTLIYRLINALFYLL